MKKKMKKKNLKYQLFNGIILFSLLKQKKETKKEIGIKKLK